MTFAEKLQARINEAQEEQALRYSESLDRLLDNPEFIEAQRAINAKQSELRMLNTRIHQLNNIPAFVSNDGTKYKVTVYPVASTIFGHGVAELLGIISASGSAFTDDLMLQYSAITGISEIELSEARSALGTPAYCTKDGTVIPAVEGNFSKLKEVLQSIAIKLDIREFNVNSLTQDRYGLWFAKSELTAHKKADAFSKAMLLDTAKFTMED